MCDPKDTVGVDHVVQILRVCGFSVVQYDKEHDLGTDFLAFVRDHQHFDLGGFIKVQVKNRPSLTENPSTDNGRVGWWVRDFTYHDDPSHGYSCFRRDSEESLLGPCHER